MIGGYDKGPSGRKVLASPEFSGIDRVKDREKEKKESVLYGEGVFAHVKIISERILLI